MTTTATIQQTIATIEAAVKAAKAAGLHVDQATIGENSVAAHVAGERGTVTVVIFAAEEGKAPTAHYSNLAGQPCMTKDIHLAAARFSGDVDTLIG